MKLEDLYKSELSDLHIEPKQGGFERVKTSLVQRIVKNTIIFSTAFILFFVGLGELAKYKKTAASQEFKFPVKYFKQDNSKLNSEKSVDEPIDEMLSQNNGIKTSKKSTKKYFVSAKNNQNELINNNINDRVKSRFDDNYVDADKPPYRGKGFAKNERLSEQKFGNLLSDLKQNISSNLIAKNDFSILNQELNANNNETANEKLKEITVEKTEAELSALNQKDKESESTFFPAKKERKILFSVASYYISNNTLQDNGYHPIPSSMYQVGIVYPFYKLTFNARVGVNYSVNNLSLTGTYASQNSETEVKNYSIDIPFLFEYPIRLINKTYLNIGLGTRINNTIVHKEKTILEDGSAVIDELYSDAYKKNYFTFFGHCSLSQSIKKVKINLFANYQPSYARELTLTGKNSIYNAYGVSSLQIGFGLDF